MSYTGIAARILQIANVLIGRMRGGPVGLIFWSVP